MTTETIEQELHRLLHEEAEYLRYNRFYEMYPDSGPLSREHYPRHMECFAAGREYQSRCFMGGNGTGKTYGVTAYELTCHLTGEYPHWWVGRRFNGPIEAWVAGDTRETVRDIIQAKIIGDVAKKGDAALGTGMIPRNRIKELVYVKNTNRCADFATIEHTSGGNSVLGFKSYDQGREAFQGTEKHIICLDEEPPEDIFDECTQRGRVVDGITLLTFTPLSGGTAVVNGFLDWKAANAKGARKILITCSWDDVPHLTEEWKKATLAATPLYMRDARIRGIPTAGRGRIYPVEEEEFVIKPVQIPSHWRRCFGFDGGWHNTAAVWMAWDKDEDVVYVYSEYKRGEQPIDVHAVAILARGRWIPGAGDAAAREGHSNDTVLDLYKARGVNLVLANKAVDLGIQTVMSRLSTGKLKVFNTCQKWLNEYRTYSYDEKQNIIKHNDHLMDACFTEDCEVLTRTGWKPWPAATKDDEFATMNMDTGVLEYQRASEMVQLDWDGEVVDFNNKTHLRVTPNHRMVVLGRNDGYTTRQIKRADEVTIWDKLVTAPSGWVGRDSLDLPFGADDEDLAEMLGWWVAEGSLSNSGQSNQHKYEVIISQIKPDGVARLQDLLGRCPGSWCRCGNDFKVGNKPLYEMLKPMSGAGNKRVPRCIMDASPRLIQAFLRGYIGGDGWIQLGTRCSATVSRGLADDLQELYLKLGKASSLIVRKAQPYSIQGRTGTNTRDQFWVLEHRKQTAMLRDSRNKANFERSHYSGKVYCAQVPNGTLIVRSNGRTCVTGNTRFGVMSGLSRATTERQPQIYIPNISFS